MAGYICALAISLFAVVAGSFCMVYPLYHKHVCKEPATAKVIDIHKERRDGTWHSYPVFQYRANGQTIVIQHNVSPSSSYNQVFFIENSRFFNLSYLSE